MAAFVAFVILVGGASVSMRITFVEMPPFSVGASRFILGALVFWGLVFIRKIPLPRGRALFGAVLFGILSVGLSFILMSWGLTATPASTYQVLMALVPLLTLFLAYFHGVERIGWQGLLGAVLAVAGIAIVVGSSRGAKLSLPHVLAIIAGAACLAEAGVVANKFPRYHPFMTNAIAMTIGSLMLTGASIITGEKWVIPQLPSTWIAFAYLLVFVTIIVFLLYLYVLNNWTATGTSYGFVLTPLITVVLASFIAGEQITWNFAIGGVLVISGVVFGALLPVKPHEEHPASEVVCRCS